VAPLLRLRVPVINVSNKLGNTGIPSVIPDDLAVGRMAAEHLVEQGFHNLGYLGHRGAVFTKQRGAGFLSVARRAGCTYDQLILPSRWHRGPAIADSQARISEWLAGLPKPVGVMTVTDSLARPVVEECEALGIAIPENVALIGVDNYDLYCQTLIPPLSSVDTSLRLVGYKAAELMASLLRGEPAPAEPILVPPRGVERRQSTDVLAVEDPLVAEAVRFIRDHAHEHVNVQDFVQGKATSRRSLERRFAKIFGRSPHDELVRVRLDRVRSLLVDTALSPEQISERCGFAYRTTMYAVFRKATGMSPGEYRKRFGRR
jgi:LacI family transcriptional regulator